MLARSRPGGDRLSFEDAIETENVSQGHCPQAVHTDEPSSGSDAANHARFVNRRCTRLVCRQLRLSAAEVAACICSSNSAIRS